MSIPEIFPSERQTLHVKIAPSPHVAYIYYEQTEDSSR